MNGTTADINEIRVPEQDGIIAQALTDLDERLSAWATAMREACQQLAEATAKCERVALQESSDHSSSVPTTPPSDERISDDTSPEAASNNTDAGEMSRLIEPEFVCQDTDSSCQQSGVVESSNDDETLAEEAQREDATSSAASTIVTQADESTEPAQAETTEPADKTETVDDDEALLASLDAEAGKAIRVMRRLSPTHKSVRELLEEYEASRAAQQVTAKPKKRSWFARG